MNQLVLVCIICSFIFKAGSLHTRYSTLHTTHSYTTHYTLHTTHYTLLHYTLHTLTLHTTHSHTTLHTTHYTLHTLTLHTLTLRTLTLHTTHYTLHTLALHTLTLHTRTLHTLALHYTLHTTHYTLSHYTTHYTLHTTHSYTTHYTLFYARGGGKLIERSIFKALLHQALHQVEQDERQMPAPMYRYQVLPSTCSTLPFCRMYVCVCMECTSLHIGPFSLLATGLFSRSRLRGTQGGRVYSRGKFGPLAVLRGGILWVSKVVRPDK